MRISNPAKNTVIDENARLCGCFSKIVGLMFSKKKKRALVFEFGRERIIALHMLFVFYPIDVLFLDKNMAVVDIKERFMPFTFCKSGRKAKYAIELPCGAAKKSKTAIGDIVEFKD